MNVLFVNDTSNYHCGSFLTCETLFNLINPKCTTLEKLKTGDFKHKEEIYFYDLVIINGEGTFHHNSLNVNKLYNLAKRFKSKGKKVVLINTVIQDINYNLDIFDYISVRESKSSYGKYPVVHDVCFYKKIDNSKNKEEYVLFVDSVTSNKKKDIYFQYNKFEGEKKYVEMNSKLKLDECMELFKNSFCIVTGRYHGVVFSIMCEKRFLAIESNTHKISGLLKDLNLMDNLISDFDKLKEKIELSIKPNVYTDKIKKDIENMIDNFFKT